MCVVCKETKVENEHFKGVEEGRRNWTDCSQYYFHKF